LSYEGKGIIASIIYPSGYKPSRKGKRLLKKSPIKGIVNHFIRLNNM